MELMVAIFLVVLVAQGNTFNPLSWLFLFDNLHSAYQLNLNGAVIELNFHELVKAQLKIVHSLNQLNHRPDY